MRLRELAEKVFRGIKEVEIYVSSHYKPHTNIESYSIYLAICGHEDDENIYDERPVLILRTSGEGLDRNEIEAFRITSIISNRKDTFLIKNFKKAGLDKLSEIKLGYKFRIRKNWLGKKLGQLQDPDFTDLVWKINSIN